MIISILTIYVMQYSTLNQESIEGYKLKKIDHILRNALESIIQFQYQSIVRQENEIVK